MGSESTYSECETFTDEDTGTLVPPECLDAVEEPGHGALLLLPGRCVPVHPPGRWQGSRALGGSRRSTSLQSPRSERGRMGRLLGAHEQSWGGHLLGTQGFVVTGLASRYAARGALFGARLHLVQRHQAGYPCCQLHCGNVCGSFISHQWAPGSGQLAV